MKTEESRSAEALLRLVAGSTACPAVGLFSVAGAKTRLTLATPAFWESWPGDADRVASDIDTFHTAIAQNGAEPAPHRIPRAKLNCGCAFAAVAPVVVAGQVTGLIAILDYRSRVLTQPIKETLQNAADMWAGIHAAQTTDHQRARFAGLSNMLPHRRLSRTETYDMLDHGRSRDAGIAKGAICLIDIDRFLSVIEVLGGAMAEKILDVVAERLSDMLDASDMFARLESDRFLIFTRRDDKQVLDFTNRINGEISVPIKSNESSIRLLATIGVVPLAGRRTASPRLLQQAENAVSRGKRMGGNRVVFHDDAMDVEAFEASQLVLELDNALGTDQIYLAYQPYLDLKSQHVAGLEALLRWDHPKRGKLEPAHFIDIAENSAQILPLGNWVLETAIVNAAKWPGTFTLSVNISSLQIKQPNFVARIESYLEKANFPAHRLELEITESVSMLDDVESKAQIQRVIDRGIGIALDDFGTGYSALAYLAQIPHNRIKLDKRFIQDLNDPATRKLIDAIVVTAQARGVMVTAEGIETVEQLREVCEMGFTHGQGFKISAPLKNPKAFLSRAAANVPA